MEPVIVTGFWDVGRGSNCLIPRTNDRYFQEFEQWARIRNKLIVFVDADKVNRVYEIRKSYGLEDRTQIIPIDNIFNVEREMYDKLVAVEKKGGDFGYKLIPNAMSCNAKFDYAWYIVFWAISVAGKLCNENEMLAWFDFGFNHMNHCYTNMEEFDFLWNCTQTDMSKIHIYSMMDINDVSIWDCIQFQFDTVMTPLMLIPAKLSERMWETTKEVINALLLLEIIDDDQLVLMVACKNHPELYEVHISEMWYLALKENGADHLSVNGRKVCYEYDMNLPIEKAIVEGSISEKNRFLQFANRILCRLKRYELKL